MSASPCGQPCRLLLHDCQHGLHLLENLGLRKMSIAGICCPCGQSLQCPAKGKTFTDQLTPTNTMLAAPCSRSGMEM